MAFFFLIFCLSALTGCIETQFDFKTVVYEDGSISRETRIDGRGADLFKAPEGPGWEVKTSQTRGQEAFFANTYYHVLAYGHFERDALIAPDYQFDLEKQAKNWGEDQQKKMQAAGIQAPYQEHLFSRNNIRVTVAKGWMTQTYTYEELFKNSGILELLLLDIEEELQKNRGIDEEPWDRQKLKETARARLEKEILTQIRFSSELTLPGRVMNSNASRREGEKSIWEFSLADFKGEKASFRIQAVSQSLRMPALIWTMGFGLGGVALLTLIFVGMKKKN